jgi:Flp pilus assembly protein TadD
MRWAWVIAFWFCAGVAWAQSEVPTQCRYDSNGRIDYQACADATEPGDSLHTLSRMNLGTHALMAGDYAAAVNHYDAAQPPDGRRLMSDPLYHAYRASALHHVGRKEEAALEARTALAVLRNPDGLPASAMAPFTSGSEAVEILYALILPVLHDARDSQAATVLVAYLAMPERDWVSWANRAGVLEQIGELESALGASERALALQPSDAGVQNNHCYILVRLGRPEAALPFCQSARELAPNIASIRHSLAATFVALRRCGEARAEMAEARRLDPVSETYREDMICVAS